MARKGKKLVGHVDVDAGLIWVGDPCYVMGDEASDRVTDWGDFCEKLFSDKNRDSTGASEPLGKGVGIAVQSGYGDGSYPVYLEYHDDGVPSRITIEFN